MNKLFCKFSNHASRTAKHVRNHKHRYALGTFGSFAIVKMVILFAGLFGLANLASTFASYTPVTVDMPNGTYLKRVVPKTGEVNITDPDQATKLQSWFNQGVLSLTVVKNHQLTFFSLASADTLVGFLENINIKTWGGDSTVLDNAINNLSLLDERDTAAAYMTNIISHNGSYTTAHPYSGSSLGVTNLSDYQEFFTKYPLLKLGSDNFILPHLTSWTSHPIDIEIINNFLKRGYVANLGNINTTSSTPFFLASIETFLKWAEAEGPSVLIAGGNANFSPNQQHYLLQYSSGINFETLEQLGYFLNKGFVTNIGTKDNQEVSFGMPGVVIAGVDTYLKFAELIIGKVNTTYSLGSNTFTTDDSGNFTNIFLNLGRNLLQLGSNNVLTPDAFNRFLDKGSVVSFGYIVGAHIQPNGVCCVDTYLKLAEAMGLTITAASAGDGVAVASLIDQGAIPLSTDQQTYIGQYINNISSDNQTPIEIRDRIFDKGIVTNIGYRDNKDVSFGMPGFVLASVETYLKFAEAMGLTASAAAPASVSSGVNITAINHGISNNIFALGNDNFTMDVSGNVSNIFLNAGKNILQLGSNLLTPEEIDTILDKGSVVSFGYKFGNSIQPNNISSVETYLKLAEKVGMLPAPASAGDGVGVASLADQGIIGFSPSQKTYISQYLNTIHPIDTATNIQVRDAFTTQGFVTNIGSKDGQEVSFGIPGVVLANVDTYLKFAEAINHNYLFALGAANFATDIDGNFTNIFLNAGKNILQFGDGEIFTTTGEMFNFLDRGSVVSFGYKFGNSIQPNGISSVETYLKLAEAIYFNNVASAGDGVGVASASLTDQGIIPLDANQKTYISQYLNINTEHTLDFFYGLLDQGFVTNIGIQNNQEVAFGTPSAVLASIETYLKYAESVGLTSNYATIYPLGTDAFTMDTSGNFTNVFLNLGKNILHLSSVNIAARSKDRGSEILNRILYKGNVVSFGYIYTNTIAIQPYSFSSVETYLKLAEAIGMTDFENNTPDGTIIGLSDNQQKYISQYTNTISSDEKSSTIELFDRLLDKGFVTNLGIKNHQEVAFGTPSAVLASIETYLRYAEAVGLTVNYYTKNNTYGLGTDAFTMDTSGNFTNVFLNLGKNILQLSDKTFIPQVIDSMFDKGIVIGFGYIINNNTIQSNGISSVETYLKYANGIGLTVGVASASDGVAVTSIIDQGIIPLSTDQNIYIGQYINNITSNNWATTETLDIMLDKGIITNIGYRNNQDVSFGMPGFVLASVETYLKFANAIGLISAVAAASTDSGIHIASYNTQVNNNIFALGNDNFAMDASGNVTNPLLNVSKTILDLGNTNLQLEDLYFISHGSIYGILDKGIVTSFGYITNNKIIQPNGVSSVGTYLKLAEAIGMTAQSAIPASAGNGVAITSLVDQGMIPLSPHQQIYINQYIDNLTPDTTKSNIEVWNRFFDKGLVTNVGYRDHQDITIGLPSIVFASIETYLKFAEAIGMTAQSALPASAGDGVTVASVLNPNAKIFGIGNDNFAMDASGNVKNIFLNLPKAMLEVTGDYNSSTKAERVDRLLDKGPVVGLTWVTDYHGGLPSTVASVETYLKFAEAMGLTAQSAIPASAGDGVAITATSSSEGVIDFSLAQRAYFQQYFDLLPMNNGEVVDNLLDKGIVTNIGYHNDHDIAIGLPSFVFTDIENYVKLAEAVGLTSPISTPAAASGGVVIANIGGGQQNAIFNVVGINNFASDASGTMRNPLLNIPLAIIKRMTQIGPDPLEGMQDLLYQGMIVNFGYPEESVAGLPTLFSNINSYLNLIQYTSSDSTPTQPIYNNPFTPDQEVYFNTLFTQLIDTTNANTIIDTLDQFLNDGMIIDTIADRGYSDSKPEPWDMNAFGSELNVHSDERIPPIGLVLPFDNTMITDNLIVIGISPYINHYYEEGNTSTLTHNRFANVDLGGVIITYLQPQNYFVSNTRCGDGTKQTPNSDGLRESCDDGLLNGQTGSCNTTCTAILIPKTPDNGGGGSNGGGGGAAGGSITPPTTGTTHAGAGTGSTTGSTSSSEIDNAYTRAFGLHITTLSKSQAGLDLPSLRAHIAKMMVEYVKNILKKVPDTTKKCSFTDVAKQTPELQGYITEACQLGLMGQSITAFRPNDSLTRAEFVTLLARALYGDTYNNSTPYYAKSMAKLFADKVIKDTNPKLIEIKAYILLMLMRSTTEK